MNPHLVDTQVGGGGGNVNFTATSQVAIKLDDDIHQSIINISR